MSDASQRSPQTRFMQGLRRGVIEVQRCLNCQHCFFFPRTHCPHCHGAEYVWQGLQGGGALYSFSVIPAGPSTQARNVVLVDLDEGFRMLSSCPGLQEGALRIGMRVRAAIEVVDVDGMRVVFHPEEAL